MVSEVCTSVVSFWRLFQNDINLYLCLLQGYFYWEVIIIQSNMRLCILGALCLMAAVAVFAEEKKDKDKPDIGTVVGIDLGTTYSWWVYIAFLNKHIWRGNYNSNVCECQDMTWHFTFCAMLLAFCRPKSIISGVQNWSVFIAIS